MHGTINAEPQPVLAGHALLIMVLQAQRMIELGKTSLRLGSAMVWANLNIVY